MGGSRVRGRDRKKHAQVWLCGGGARRPPKTPSSLASSYESLALTRGGSIKSTYMPPRKGSRVSTSRSVRNDTSYLKDQKCLIMVRVRGTSQVSGVPEAIEPSWMAVNSPFAKMQEEHLDPGHKGESEGSHAVEQDSTLQELLGT